MVMLSSEFAPAFDANSCVPDALERIFAEPCRLNTWQWAKENIVLDEKASPTNPGPYDPDVAPHTKFLQECLDRPEVRQLTLKKNSQGGFTQGVLNKLCKIVAVEPQNCLYVIDSLQEIKRVARTRLKPMLESCHATRQVINEDPENELQTLTFYLRDMSIYFTGGGSIGAVANKPISFAVVDEADKIPRMTGGHSNVVEEVKARFKTVDNFKLVVLSAPNEEIDITTVEYKRGSQHKFHVRCPHCQHQQVMDPERVIYSHCKLPDGTYDLQRVRHEAYYTCSRAGTAACPDGKIYERHKRLMALNGEWLPTNPNAEPGHVSMESSDLFSLFPGATFGLIALDMIDAQTNPAKKKAIWSGRFGREWKTQRATFTAEDIRRLRGKYKRGTLPPDCGQIVYLPLCSDVQGDVRKWIRGAFNRKGELFVVDYGASFTYADLIPVADTPIKAPGSELALISHEGGIDEGYETSKVRTFCLSTNHRFFPFKGRGDTQMAIRGALVGISEAPHEGELINVYHFNDYEFKRALYIDRIRDLDKIRLGTSKVPRLWLPEDADEEFMSELCHENLIPELTAFGQTVHRWHCTGTNDFGDALKLLYVLWFVAGPEILARLAAEETAARNGQAA